MNSTSRSISAIRFPQKIWQYLILFQSIAQLVSWVVVIGIAGVILQGIIWLHGCETTSISDMFPPIAVGSLAVVLMVVKAQFSFEKTDYRIRILHEKLTYFGYVEMARSTGRVTYRQNLWRIFRWDEGNITVEHSGNKIIVSGPHYLLRLLRKLLLQD